MYSQEPTDGTTERENAQSPLSISFNRTTDPHTIQLDSVPFLLAQRALCFVLRVPCPSGRVSKAFATIAEMVVQWFFKWCEVLAKYARKILYPVRYYIKMNNLSSSSSASRHTVACTHCAGAREGILGSEIFTASLLLIATIVLIFYCGAFPFFRLHPYSVQLLHLPIRTFGVAFLRGAAFIEFLFPFSSPIAWSR